MEFEVDEMALHPVKLSHLTARLIALFSAMTCEYQILKLVLLQRRLYTSKHSSHLPLFGQIVNSAPNSLALVELMYIHT